MPKGRMYNDYKTIVKNLGDLPPMPAVAIKVLELLRNPYCSAKLLANAISHDAAVSGRILRIANSPIYGQQKKITTLEGAIVVLGENTLRSLVLETSLRGINKTFGRFERLLWEDSIGCAIGSRIVAQRFHVADPEEAFIAGLFRHVGKIVMSNHSRDAYQKIFEAHRNGEGALQDLEKAYFAFTHNMVGAAVLDNWNLSPAMVQCALHHNDLDFPAEIDEEIVDLTAIVNIADSFCRYLGIGREERDTSTLIDEAPGAEYLEADPEELRAAAAELYEVFSRERDFFLA